MSVISIIGSGTIGEFHVLLRRQGWDVNPPPFATIALLYAGPMLVE
jgi:hypothetical protein